VAAAIAALVASSPAALDTLKELATALGNDPNFATTMVTALAGKLGTTAQAADSAQLGGTAAASFLLAATAAATYATKATPTFSSGYGMVGSARLWWSNGAAANVLYCGTTSLAFNNAADTTQLCLIDNATGYFNTIAHFRVAGVQVVGARQTGLGATLASTHCGATYTATEQGLINALIDKVVLLETKLKLHGLVAT